MDPAPRTLGHSVFKMLYKETGTANNASVGKPFGGDKGKAFFGERERKMSEGSVRKEKGEGRKGGKRETRTG